MGARARQLQHDRISCAAGISDAQQVDRMKTTGESRICATLPQIFWLQLMREKPSQQVFIVFFSGGHLENDIG